MERNTRPYMAFVDFEKAFDSLDREVPGQIVRKTRVFDDSIQAKILQEGESTRSWASQGVLAYPFSFLWH